MRFEWDERKRRSNLRKHGLDFRDAPSVFGGKTFMLIDDRFDYGEERFLTYGLLEGRAVAIVSTEARGITRIISMRKANSEEEKEYFAQIGDGLEAD